LEVVGRFAAGVDVGITGEVADEFGEDVSCFGDIHDCVSVDRLSISNLGGNARIRGVVLTLAQV
jgi:hypothetical protein